MRLTNINSAALFMALALTAAPIATPALAGVAHGGAPLASTDEYGSLKTGESPTAEKGDKTVEVPAVEPVNIQPGVRSGDRVQADADANARLMQSNHLAADKTETNTTAKTVINPEAPPVVK